MADQQPPDGHQPPDRQELPDRQPGVADRPPGRGGADETREMPAAAAEDDTEVLPTSGPPREGGTAADEARRDRPQPAPPALPTVPTWSGRAGVPPPDSVVVREAVPVEEEPAAGGRWWLPVALALLALALLALLGLGLWLITRGDDGANPVPALTSSSTTTTASVARGEPSPSTPGTPSRATAAPTPSAPAQVVVPRLVGLDSDTARSILDRLGLAYRLTSRADPGARPGTVLETDPTEGSVVSEGTRITLVVASAPPSPSPPSPALPSPTSPSPTV